MADKKYYWLRLKDDFFKDKAIKKLRKIAGGDTYVIIYLKLQLLSLKNEGKLIFENLEDTFVEELALELDEESENVEITVAYLRKCGLIEEINEGEFELPQTIKCIGSETKGAERVRRHREKQKALPCNDSVTIGNIEKKKEIDKEKELDINNKKNKKSKEPKLNSFETLINSFSENLELKQTIFDFIEMRKLIKKPLTNRALVLILNKLKNLSQNEQEQIQILNQSIENSWQSIFELKSNGGQKSGSFNKGDNASENSIGSKYNFSKLGV